MEKRFFEFLTHDERVDCLALGTIGKQPSGTKLLQAGDRPRALFVLLAGNAEVRRGDGVVLARLVSGDIFGGCPLSRACARAPMLWRRATSGCSRSHRRSS